MPGPIDSFTHKGIVYDVMPDIQKTGCEICHFKQPLACPPRICLGGTHGDVVFVLNPDPINLITYRLKS